MRIEMKMTILLNVTDEEKLADMKKALGVEHDSEIGRAIASSFKEAMSEDGEEGTTYSLDDVIIT